MSGANPDQPYFQGGNIKSAKKKKIKL